MLSKIEAFNGYCIHFQLYFAKRQRTSQLATNKANIAIAISSPKVNLNPSWSQINASEPMSLAQGLLAVMMTLAYGVFTSYRQIHIPQFNLHNSRAIFLLFGQRWTKIEQWLFSITNIVKFRVETCVSISKFKYLYGFHKEVEQTRPACWCF